MKIPLFDLNSQNSPLKEKFLKELSAAIDKNEFVHGEAIKKFEKEFADYCDTKYCLAVNSGTTALILTLKAMGFGLGDEIITTPCTFSATADAIVWVGASPVFVDVDEKTGNIDPKEIEKKVNSKTKAILLVHPCQMDEINKIARKHKLKVIEDASHAHGSRYKGKKIGSLGDVACFSAYPSKTLGAFGNAGMITSDNKKFIKKAREIADNGVFDYSNKYLHNLCGINALINNFQAISLSLKLKNLEKEKASRLKVAKTYNRQLEQLGQKAMFWSEEVSPSLYVYAFQANQRAKLKTFLEKKEIGVSIYYPVPLHLQKSFKYLGYKKGDFPRAEKFFDNTLSLPLYSSLSKEKVDYIISSLEAFFAD